MKPALMIAFAIVLTFCFAANAANDGQGGELMESKAFIAMTQKHLNALAGKNAISCGDVQLKGNPNAANKCAQTAFQNRKAFYVSYEFWGIDSQVTVALAMNSSGHLYSLQADSMGFSPPFKAESKVEEGDHLIITPCPKPYALNVARGNVLSCFPLPHHRID